MTEAKKASGGTGALIIAGAFGFLAGRGTADMPAPTDDRPVQLLSQSMSSQPVYFENCAAARAAGAAPVYRGDSGYAPHLDRDNDGVGCE